MWKDYSSDYIKHNRAVSYSIRAASFISALFLSFLCNLFYNFWLDSVQEGEKEVPHVLTAFYLIVLLLVCVSLILVIHNSFAVSMQNRIHQFGIFSSIGATPGQIRTCLLQEAFMVSLFPVLAGILTGVLFGFGTVRAMGAFAENLAGGRRMEFSMHPAILAVSLAVSLLTVLISAFIPARKLGKMTPLESVRGSGELQPDKKRRFSLAGAWFGIEGELSGNALRAQKKALRTTTLSLTFAFSGFMLMQCFFTISTISTKHTYFEAYQDAWDVMVTVEDTRIEDFEIAEEIRRIQGLESAVIYQKAEAESLIPIDQISSELQEKGGLEALAGIYPAVGEDVYQIKTSLVVLDDESFAEYCDTVGIRAQMDGVIVYNRIWDSIDSNFRYPEYLPYIKEDTEKIALVKAMPQGVRTEERVEEPTEETNGMTVERMVEIPVLACSEIPPVLREEYEDYALVQFMPLSLWKAPAEMTKGSGEGPGIRALAEEAETDLYIRGIAGERNSAEALDVLEKNMMGSIGKGYEAESENRIQEKKDNDTMIWGYKMILGGLCALFALIGIAGMFANTLGFLHQRKREFARYMSVGLTPEGIRKIFCIEAAALVGRPLLFALAAAIAASACMIKMSFLDPMEFIREAPAGPIAAFVLIVVGFTALAYYLGGRKILRIDLAGALRDDVLL